MIVHVIASHEATYTKKEDGIEIRSFKKPGLIFIANEEIQQFVICAVEAYCRFDDRFKGKNWKINLTFTENEN
jgi:hypothetical protein